MAMLYAFDGTWSHDCSPHQWTNVCRLAKACHPGSVEYYAGVANPLECKGVVPPRGSHAAATATIVDDALHDFALHWQAGHEVVDVIAFSRGAAAALIFLNKIRDWAAGDPRRKSVRFRFVGLFDALDTVGIGDHDWDFWYRKTLPPKVESAVHAIAIHETRAHYAVLDVKGATQQAFAGNHCDVGGGYSASGLSDITLEWMYRAAEAAGLRFHRSLPELGLHPDPRSPPHRATDPTCVHRPRTMPEGTIMPPTYRWPILREDPSPPRPKGAPFRRQPLTWSFMDEEFAKLGALDLEEDLVVLDEDSDPPAARTGASQPGPIVPAPVATRQGSEGR
jgi:hypothetical protein